MFVKTEFDQEVQIGIVFWDSDEDEYTAWEVSKIVASDHPSTISSPDLPAYQGDAITLSESQDEEDLEFYLDYSLHRTCLKPEEFKNDRRIPVIELADGDREKNGRPIAPNPGHYLLVYTGDKKQAEWTRLDERYTIDGDKVDSVSPNLIRVRYSFDERDELFDE